MATPLAAVQLPSDMIMLHDTRDSDIEDWTDWQTDLSRTVNGGNTTTDYLPYDRHNGGFDAAYVDGHVKFVRRRATKLQNWVIEQVDPADANVF